MGSRIMEKAYESRSLKGFDGDEIAAKKIKSLIHQYEIDLVIECGTYIGGTARRLAMMCNEVVTIEVNPEYYDRARQVLLPCKNTEIFCGSTLDILPMLLEIYLNKRILFFIDSHWEKHNPLLEELEVIHKSGLRPVCVVHDFKVPGHPELGFDTYKDIVYEWEWIRPSIEKIYGVDGYVKEYNDKAEGAKRGIVYLMPK